MPPNEASTPSPWEAFQQRLEVTLDSMETDQFFVIGMNHPALEALAGARPYAQVARRPQSWHAELSGNRYLADEFQLTPQDEESLSSTGWDLDGRGCNWGFDALTAGEAAARITGGLRDIFDVKHPTLLTVENAGAFEGQDLAPDLSVLVGSSDGASREVSVQPMPRTIDALIVEDREHLIQALELSLSQWSGLDLQPDQDGVFVLRVDDVLLIVEPSTSSTPWIHITALVAERVHPTAALMEYLNDATAGLSAVQLFSRNQSVYARLDVIGSPFILGVLGLALETCLEATRAHREQILRDHGGRNMYPDGLGGYL